MWIGQTIILVENIVSEELEEKNPISGAKDPFLDEEDEDVILKVRMKIYDVFMGNWQRLLYLLGVFLVGTLVYGLYESAVESAIQENSGRLAKSSTQSFQPKNKILADFPSLNQDFQRAVKEFQSMKQNNNDIMKSIQLQMKARDINEELYLSRSVFFSLDALIPNAVFIKPFAYDRATFYSTSHLGNAINNAAPSLMELSQIREMAILLADEVEKIEGPTKVFGYIKLGQTWIELKEYDAAITAFDSALKVSQTELQEWMITSQISQVYLQKGEMEKGISLLQSFVSKKPAGNFFAEYGNYHVALLQESSGDKEGAKSTLSKCTPTRFVEEYQQLQDRL